MKKKLSSILALLLVLCMAVTLFAGCGNTQDDPTDPPATNPTDEPTAPTQGEDEPADTLVYATSTFEQKFSTFFATTAYDMEVVDLTTGATLGADRGGAMILNGIEGETREFNGTDYTYYSMANCEVVQNADGTVDYNLTMRDDIVFSDGTPATIDDVIFGIYVLADPTYDGASTIYALPIEGMAEYYSSLSTKANLIAAAGYDAAGTADPNGIYTAEDSAAYWAAYDAAGVIFAQEIVDYVLTNYPEEAPNGTVAEAAAAWAFGGLAEDATAADFWEEIKAAYGNDPEAIEAESAGSALADLINAELGDAAADMNANVSTSNVENIAGVIKTGDYSMTIHCTEFDATAIYNMSFAIAPLHYYGDPAQYDYDNNQFGFPKGDLSIVKSKTTTPLGCGPYAFESYANGVVTLKANPYYYQGEPKIGTILLQEAEDSDYIPGIGTGTFDIAVPSINANAITALTTGNSNGETTGDVYTTILVDYRGYGYLGINSDLVSVGGDSSSDASKNLRKAIMTLLSVYRDSVINSYYGDRATVIQYPISNTSWAAPRPTDEGYQNCYSVDVDGNPIYTDGMNDEQKFEAALQAAVGYLQAAGYTYDEATGTFTAAPDGASLEYEILIPGQGEQDHPAYGVALGAAEQLAKVGITLNVNDVVTSVWNSALNGNTCEMWAAAWQSTADPDMYQVYHSRNAQGQNTNSNHYQIMDADLDQIIVDARASADNTYRKAAYQEAMEIILDWACELPLYQRKDGTIVSTERVNVDTMPKDMTPYWGWYAEIETLEMN